MLVKGLDVVYLRSDMAVMQRLNPLLTFIWATVNERIKVDTETSLRLNGK